MNKVRQTSRGRPIRGQMKLRLRVIPLQSIGRYQRTERNLKWEESWKISFFFLFQK